MGSATNICEEMVIEILRRLPAKSLVRFMAVCRLWKTNITSPQFSLVSNRPTKLLVHTDRECHALVEDGYQNHLMFETDFPSKDKEIPCDFAELMGSDNGLVCIRIRSPYRKTVLVIIWNPCIRKHVLLPKKPFHDDKTHVTEEFGSGFGGTISGPDYKYVSVVGHYGCGCTKKSVDIYSLKTGTWQRKEMVRDTPMVSTYFDRSCALLRGRLHWVCPRSKQIFSFELEDEVFDQDAIMVPTQLTASNHMNVTVIRESLAVIANELGDQCSTVWVMEKYGDVDSWNKKWNIVRSEMVHSLKSGELLLGLVRKDCPSESKLVTYNPETTKTRDFGGGESSLLPGLCGFTKNYKESLVLLADDYHAAPDKPTHEGRQQQGDNPVTTQNLPMVSQPAHTYFQGYYPVWTGGPGFHWYPVYKDQYGSCSAWTGFNWLHVTFNPYVST